VPWPPIVDLVNFFYRKKLAGWEVGLALFSKETLFSTRSVFCGLPIAHVLMATTEKILEKGRQFF